MQWVSLQESIVETCSVVLTFFFLLMKSYGVTIQMKPLRQSFCMVPFVFQYFTKRNLGFFLNFDLWHPLEV